MQRRHRNPGQHEREPAVDLQAYVPLDTQISPPLVDCRGKSMGQPFDGCRGRLVGDRLPGMTMLTEPIGSIPRPASLLQAMAGFQAGKISRAALDGAYASAVQDTIERFQQTGSPVI